VIAERLAVQLMKNDECRMKNVLKALRTVSAEKNSPPEIGAHAFDAAFHRFAFSVQPFSFQPL